MSATRPAKYASQNGRGTRPPDLSHFRQNYPLTVTNFGALHEREAWLRRVWEADERWRALTETRGGAPAQLNEAFVRGAPPASLAVEAEFDVVYTGGATAILHAAVLAARYGRRVLVVVSREGEEGVESGAGVWTVSEDVLGEFERAGLFTREEIEACVTTRRRAGFVKFHDAASRVKAEPLWVEGVMDVGLDARRLLDAAVARVRAREAAGCALLADARLVRAYVERGRVSVEVEDARGARHGFAARLLVDASGPMSEVARQLSDGRDATHVRPTVGTLATGFARGEGASAVDFAAGEILVSTEDASDHRQLMWEGFGRDARRDEYATSLFFYDAIDAPADKSLLPLFERYFERLALYKRRGAHWRVARPLFGHRTVARPRGWKGRARATDDRVMVLDAGSGASPLGLGGAGARLRDLRRLTHLVHLALEADALDADSLAQVASGGPGGVARAASFADFLRPTERGAPSAVNETLNAVMAALHTLDDRVRRELFQDRLSLGALRSLLSNTAKLYPRIFARVREHLGARGTLWWLAGVAEGVLRERRGRAAEVEGLAAAREGDAAREFARHLALYEKE
ncbi:MAG TPA: hypothetical protein VFX96_02705 [Pyrinomonadaceae bacterium]|nr:hypothetical protein [Pyrinomonadaceae bacterium]